MIAEEDEPKLLTWIIIQLNDINQSNATGLAKYIITLIKQNYGDIQELKTYYIEQLKSFLKNKTAIFVNILIDGLKGYKLYSIVNFYIYLGFLIIKLSYIRKEISDYNSS